jgi:hypothetical protein
MLTVCYLLSYEHAFACSDENGWQEATELQQLAESEAMLPIKVKQVSEGANITVFKVTLLPNGKNDKYKATGEPVQVD